jgi:AraC-like DNA-binding protein
MDLDRSTHGILNPYEGLRWFKLDRQEPAADLRTWVQRHWAVHWDLAPGEQFEQEVLPHPSVELAFETRGSAVHGVGTSRFLAKLEGRGRALGVKFKPGAFVAFCALPMVELVDRVLPIGEVFGARGAELATRVLNEPNPSEARLDIERFLRELAPAVDANIELASSLVEFVRQTRGVTRSEALARHAGMSLRSLQRLFERYLGLGPKWVICRARVQEAAERVAAGADLDWAALALSLGYHDQSHLIHDFKAQTGFTPAAYASRCAAAAAQRALGG